MSHYSVHSEEWASLFLVDLYIDYHGALVIFRSASVRPYTFKLTGHLDYFQAPRRPEPAVSTALRFLVSDY